MHIAWQSEASRGERLDARDIIWLCTLGAAERRAISIEAPLCAIEELVGFIWRPARDVVASCVTEMLRLGCLDLVIRDGVQRLRINAEGRSCLQALMTAKIGRPRSLMGQVGVRVKLAHLDLLPRAERRRVLSELITEYEQELALLRVDLAPVWCGMPGQRWLARDGAQLQQDVALLRELLGEESRRGARATCSLAGRG